jgi:tetratricopeptide (TPR) repeat protein
VRRCDASPGRRAGTSRRLFAAALLGVLGAGAVVVGCSGWDPRSPFHRNAPEVNEAIDELDAGNLPPAEETLEQYLGTGACADAGIGLPDAVRLKSSGSFDLGLTLFYLAEKYGQRFGDEELSDGGPGQQEIAARRSAEIDCALVVVKAIAADPHVPADLRARARYLAGNLEFLRKKYEDAVKYYDQSLELVPGLPPDAGGDGLGRDAAWNRAIALRRIDDQKDAGNDAADGSDGSDNPDSGDKPDAGKDGGDKPDAGKDGGDDGDGGDKGDAAADAGGDAGGNDGGQDAGSNPQEPPPASSQEPANPSQQQDDRILDQLEQAPTYQQQEAKAKAGNRRGRAMEDK